jgi:hypothetical protein
MSFTFISIQKGGLRIEARGGAQEHTFVGSISLKGDEFIDAIKKRPDTLLISVSEKNRDYLVEEVFTRKGRD